MLNKQQIKNNFDSCALWYDMYAIPQNKIAQNLASLCKGHILNSGDMLEIGCGTGFMAEQVLNIKPTANIMATDISPNMLRTFSCKFPNIPCSVMDGENPNSDKQYDFIYSNLTFQWFKNLPEIIAKYKTILNNGGTIAFSTLGDRNFKQWQESCDYANLQHYQDMMLSEAEIVQAFGDDFEVKLEREFLDMQFATPLDFLSHIRNIGAKASDQKTPLAKLKKACKYLNDKHNNTVSYYVVYIIARRR